MNAILFEIEAVEACQQGYSPATIVGELMQRAVTQLDAQVDASVREIRQRKSQFDAAVATVAAVATDARAYAPEEAQAKAIGDISNAVKEFHEKAAAELQKEKARDHKGHRSEIENSVNQLGKALNKGDKKNDICI